MRIFGRKRYEPVNARKKDMPAGLWLKCSQCNEIVYTQDVKRTNGVCPKCSFHFQMKCEERLNMLTEQDSFVEWDANLLSGDPLQFVGKTSYAGKLEECQTKTNLKDAIVCGSAMIGPFHVAIGAMDFAFLGGSMGSVVGEKVTRLAERATAKRLPLIIISASGGARMYEGGFSLMQMAKTSAAIARHSSQNLPYISILTHPTTAGVMASFATLGDVILAEPRALIGFAGPRVIKQTTKQDIPDGFQRSEFVLRHGLIDMIVHRKDLKDTLLRLLRFMTPDQGSPAEECGESDQDSNVRTETQNIDPPAGDPIDR